MVGALSDLLVVREADPDGAVCDLRVAHEVRGRGHDLGDPALVVGAEERRAVARHELVPDVLRELGAVGGVESDVRGSRQRKAAALVRHDLRLDSRRGRGRADVHVRDQGDRGDVPVGRRGEGGEHVAVLVQLRVLEAELQQLGQEEA